MAQIIPARVIYDSEELTDILTTAVEGGIGYWSVITDYTRAEDLGWTSVCLTPDEEGKGDFLPKWVLLDDIQQAIDKIVSERETINVRKDIVEAVCSGDPGNIDSEGADVIVQLAMFGKLVYG
ncbi:MAG: hypothetical protein BWY85_01427 [Firmicutes bacterium ADurb.Bin506]|nr:MAG: hypothetical protein BWY85_01427 [Firmicutes bacterium ADurb.Bin506]